MLETGPARHGTAYGTLDDSLVGRAKVVVKPTHLMEGTLQYAVSKAISLKKAAEALGLSRATMYRNASKLGGFKVLGLWRFPANIVELQQQMQQQRDLECQEGEQARGRAQTALEAEYDARMQDRKSRRGRS